MPTYIKLMDGESVTVQEGYRDVYEKLLAAAWREPCEFTAQDAGSGGEVRLVTLNPTYIILFRAA